MQALADIQSKLCWKIQIFKIWYIAELWNYMSLAPFYPSWFRNKCIYLFVYSMKTKTFLCIPPLLEMIFRYFAQAWMKLKNGQNLNVFRSKSNYDIVISSGQWKWRGVCWCHLVCLSVCLSVRPSVRLWTEPCPPFILNNTSWIHFIFTYLFKQL